MAAPRKHVTGDKAPHPLAINDGGAEPAAAVPPPAPEQPAAEQPPAPAQPAAEPMDPQLMVELATVEQLLAQRDARAAKTELVTLAIAGMAFFVALAAYRAATRAELAEGDE